MALLLKNGSVFLHIPKTGGNWITAVLQELNLVEKMISHKHTDIDRFFLPVFKNRKEWLKYLFNPKSFSYLHNKPFMFCFVRHPLSWYKSWFKYQSQSRRQWRPFGEPRDMCNWHPNAILNGLGSSDFNQFVQNVIDKRPGYVTELYGWYTKPQIDFIGKQENLVEDFIRVLKIMNVSFDEDFIRMRDKVGVSELPKDPIIWDERLKEEVYKLEYAGIVRYGYCKTDFVSG